MRESPPFALREFSNQSRFDSMDESGKEKPRRYPFPGMLFKQATELVIECENSVSVMLWHTDAEVLLTIHDECL
jgi:hypothetical protein